jgi:hypothetical protein
MPQIGSGLNTGERELRAVIDEEINRLPEKYRAAVVLCYLGGKTNDQAARLLGCPSRLLARRLVRSREMLRQRLSRRKLRYGPSLFASLLAQHMAAVPMPYPLIRTTVQTAVAVAETGTTAGTVAAPVAALTEETLWYLALRRFAKIGGVAAGILIFFALLVGGYHLVFLPSRPLPTNCATDHGRN